VLPLKKDLTGKICKLLEQEGYSVYWPPRDTPQDKDELKFSNNQKAIADADVFLAVLNIPGKDFAWELGYSYGLGKRIVGYVISDDYRDSPMMRDSVTELISDNESLLVSLKKYANN